MVMSPDRGGVFDTLLNLVRMGLGGTSGSGKQFVSWVHEVDFARAVDFLIARTDLEGSINITSPHPVPNRDFMAALRRAYGARIGLPATDWMLEVGALFLRTETEVILKSRRVVPRRLVEAGFGFQFPDWSGVSTWGVVFGVASIVTPFFLGTAAAAVASGSIHAPNGQLASGFLDGWTTPLAIVIGLFALSICAYLAATYLMVENENRPELLADFRRRAIAASLVSGVLALLALAISFFDGQRLLQALTGRGLALFVLALLNGPLALWAVWRSRPRLARVAVIGQVVLVLWAWALGQGPYLVPPDLTIKATAAPEATLTAMLIVITVGGLSLIPSLWLLFRVFKARNPQARA